MWNCRCGSTARRFTNAHHRVEFANANAREMAATCLKLVQTKLKRWKEAAYDTVVHSPRGKLGLTVPDAR